MRWVAWVVGAAMVLSISGVPMPAQAGLSWNLDLATGAEWRAMTASELDAVGWAGHEGWITKNYGGLGDFADGNPATIHVAVDDEVVTLDFDPVDTISKLIAKLLVIPVVALEEVVPVDHTSDDEETFHVYDGPDAWSATYAVGSAQWTASTILDDHEVWIFPKHPNLVLTDGDDYVYALSASCGGSGGGGDGGGPVIGEGSELCAVVDVGDPPDEPEANSIPFTIFMFGEVEWCESDAYQANWATVLREHFGAIVDAHEDTPTYVEPVLTGISCTTTTEGWEWDHNRKDWAHAHPKDENDNWHPWAFNAVQNDENMDHGTNPGQDPDHSYLKSKVTLPCILSDECYYGHVYDDERGPRAWMRHLADYHAADYGDIVADTAVVYHFASVAGAGGWGSNPGQHAVVGSASRLMSSHETGHNLDGDHCDAAHIGNNRYTVIVNWDDDSCNYDPPANNWVNWFSAANRDTINSCVDGDSCYS